MSHERPESRMPSPDTSVSDTSVPFEAPALTPLGRLQDLTRGTSGLESIDAIFGS
jgi:hypothetical protein